MNSDDVDQSFFEVVPYSCGTTRYNISKKKQVNLDRNKDGGRVQTSSTMQPKHPEYH